MVPHSSPYSDSEDSDNDVPLNVWPQKKMKNLSTKPNCPKKVSDPSPYLDSENSEDGVQLHVLSQKKKHPLKKSSDNNTPKKKKLDVKTLFDLVNPSFPGFDESRIWPTSQAKSILVDVMNGHGRIDACLPITEYGKFFHDL